MNNLHPTKTEKKVAEKIELKVLIEKAKKSIKKNEKAIPKNSSRGSSWANHDWK